MERSRRALELVPRYQGQGYSEEAIAARRQWLEERTGQPLASVAAAGIAGEAMRGNVENPIGTAQVPLGVAGPLEVRGEHATGTFYVPLATTEGALVRSYERGMVALTRSGGAVARIERDENRVTPVFSFADLGQASDFTRALPGLLPELQEVAHATTRHGRLLRIEGRAVGRDALVSCAFFTADAHGMNMITRATDALCRYLAERFAPRGWTLMSGGEGEKRAAGALFAGGKGKTVNAGTRLPREVLASTLRVRAEQVAELWRRTVVGHLTAGAVGYNGHYANGLAALFIACGQDVANLANAAVGVTTFEAEPDGSLWAGVHLPALTVATVGGGTAVGTAPECLGLLGCQGADKAPRFAEVVAATLLAGELSFAAALASGELVSAHESYGRKRPAPPEGRR